MSSFLPSYHDPIFSIILMLLIVIAIALATHFWSIYRRQRLKRNLTNFLERFDTSTCSLKEQNIPYEEGMTKPLLLLAKAFEQSGNYDKAISILIYLIRHNLEDDLLIYLGRIYLRAGFLQRAEDIFLEVISRHPRRVDVLKQLELLYERLQEFNKALEALEALEAQGEDIEILKAHLNFQEIIHNHKISVDDKVKALELLLDRYPKLYRPILKELFKLEPKRAWERVDSNRLNEILDILWHLMPTQLQLDIISKDSILQTLYYARGDITEKIEVKEIGIFAIDMLVFAQECNYNQADIQFTYLCKECKQSFPVSFTRCPNCMSINSLILEETLAKKRTQEGYSLL